MREEKKGRGRPTDYAKTKKLNAYVSVKQYEEYRKAGGASWLRKMLGGAPKKPEGK